MAQFRGTLKGCRGEASRLGTKNSGLTATANGWEIGATITAGHDSEGRDFVEIRLTGGSNDTIPHRFLGRFYRHGNSYREG